MHISPNTVVRLNYRISDAQGEIIDAGEEPMEYLHGGYGDFFGELEKQLDGQEAGFEGEFHLEPEQAFGDYDASLLRIVPMSALPQGVQPGMQFEGLPEGDGEDRERIFTVTDVDRDGVVLDGNHPLAGIALRVWVHVMSVRPATEAEIEAGHVETDDISIGDASDLAEPPEAPTLH